MKKIKLFVVVLALSVSVFAQQKGRRTLDTPTKPAAAVLPTEFASVKAYSDASGVLVRWTMLRETNNFTFYVYRLDSTGERLVSPVSVTGAGTRFKDKIVSGETYEFFDEGADTAAVYSIEAVSLSGKTLRSERAVPASVESFRSSISGFNGTPNSRTDRGLIQNQLSLPKDLAAETESNTLVPDPVTHRAVIARPGVKIGVRGSGMFRVARAELQAGGFNVNSDSSLWQLYVSGVQQALSIGPNGEYIEFYGSGVDRVESDIQTYYLTVGDSPGLRMDLRTFRPSLSSVTSPNYPASTIKKERTQYLNQIFNGDAENYFGRVISATQTSFPFTLTGIDRTNANAMISIQFQGFSSDLHQVEIILNGNMLPPASSFGQQLFLTSVPIPTSYLLEGVNTIQFRSVGPSGDFSFLDFVQVDYSRKFLADSNRLAFFTRNYKKAFVEGFSSPNVRFFDITDPSRPVIVTGVEAQATGSTFAFTVPAARGRVFYAVEDSAVNSVFSVTPNDPALLTSTGNAANLVIIAHKNFLPTAEAWANYRRAQGFSAKVVEVSEVFDEFNYGVLSANSIRDFLSYAKSNWSTPPSYVLLLGDASYDSRNYQGTGYWNMVPTKFVSTLFTETGSDEALVDFDEDGLSDMAIGRIPVRLPQDAADFLTRQIAWESNLTAPLSRGALFASDLPSTWDFEGMSARIRDELPAGTPSVMINRALPNAQSELIAAMNTGKYLVNYAGHGTTGAWASTSFFWNGTVSLLTNSSSRSIFTILTCLNGYFMNLSADSLSETLIKAPNGGAIAAWASTGETTPDIQEIMALRFYEQIGVGQITRLGDLITDAKTTIPGGGDVRLSWALIGDPMLKVR